MYASSIRLATSVMVDDHLKLGENGLLYCVSEVESMKDKDQEFVMLRLYHAGDESQTTTAALVVTPFTSLKIYNQK